MVCKAHMMFLYFECCLILEEFICFFALGCVCVHVHTHFNENFLCTKMTVAA